MVDFDKVLADVVEPAVSKADLEIYYPKIGSEEWVLPKSLFEQFLLCEYAVVDLATASSSLMYQLGIRQAARPDTMLHLLPSTAQQLKVPDTVRPIFYGLNAEGAPENAPAAVARIAEQLRLIQDSRGKESPTIQLIERVDDIARLSTDVFRGCVDYSAPIKERLARARQTGTEAIRAIEKELTPIENQESGILVDLLLSYRALKSWKDVVRLKDHIPVPLARTVMVRQQYALALNRNARGEEAVEVLELLLKERAPTSETCAILGRVYKDRSDVALKLGNSTLAQEFLKKSVDTYLRGFETDWRDAFPGINAVTLMELCSPPDPRRKALMPIVGYAVERRIQQGVADYWDYATKLELAVLEINEGKAKASLADALVVIREPWEPQTTARNLRLIREARERRGEEVVWAALIEVQLADQAKKRSLP